MSPRDEHFQLIYDNNGVQSAGLFWTIPAVVVALLICAAIATSRPDMASSCSGMAPEHARLACYDTTTATMPAKGALVPKF